MRSTGIRRPALAACLLAAAGCSAPPRGASDTAAAFATRDAAAVVDPDQLVALVHGPATATRLGALAATRGYAIERRDPLPGLDLTLLTLRLPAGTDPTAAIAWLEGREPAATVGRNHAYAPAPEAASAPGRQYADALIDWPASGCPAREPVGIIDTALDADSPGLAGTSIVSRDFTTSPSVARDTAHATAVAELIAGPGRLQGARLYHAAAVGSSGSAGVDDLMRAIGWLDEQGIRLVNVSLAGPYNKILDRGFQAAADRGMTIVAAAGNDGSDAPPRYPAAFDFAVAVTAVDADLAPYARAPRGSHIDVAAPGVDVFVPGGGYLSGTSIAAPFVTAAIAADPAADLLRNARDIGVAGRDDTFGAGLATAPAGCARAG